MSIFKRGFGWVRREKGHLLSACGSWGGPTHSICRPQNGVKRREKTDAKASHNRQIIIDIINFIKERSTVLLTTIVILRGYSCDTEAVSDRLWTAE